MQSVSYLSHDQSDHTSTPPSQASGDALIISFERMRTHIGWLGTYFEDPLESRWQLTDTLLRVHKQHASQLQRHSHSIHHPPGNRPQRPGEMQAQSRPDLRPQIQTCQKIRVSGDSCKEQQLKQQQGKQQQPEWQQEKQAREGSRGNGSRDNRRETAAEETGERRQQ